MPACGRHASPSRPSRAAAAAPGRSLAWLDLNDHFVGWANELEEASGVDVAALPIAISVVAAGLAWYAWRRWREFVAEPRYHARTAADLAAAAAEDGAVRAELEPVNARLRDAIETVPEGFALFDRADRYVL